LPTDLEEHEKYCPKRPSAPPKPGTIKKVIHPGYPPVQHRKDDNESGIGATIVGAAVASSLFSHDDDSPSPSHDDDFGSSSGGGDFGGGGSSGGFDD